MNKITMDSCDEMLWREINQLGRCGQVHGEAGEAQEGREGNTRLSLNSLIKEWGYQLPRVREKSILGTSDTECKGPMSEEFVILYRPNWGQCSFVLVSSVVDFEEFERSR